MAAAATAPAPGYGTENQPANTPWRENLNTHLICPDCKQVPPDLIEENADTICANCGMVLAERLVSYESEWRTFNSDEGKGDDPNRVGEADNELLHGQQGTMIGSGGPNVSKETRKLKKAQAMQNEDKNNRALQAAYGQIETWAEKANLSTNVKHVAKGFYKRVYDGGNLKGKNHEATMAGCLFIACRQCKASRSFAEIFALTMVPKKEIGRAYKSLEKILVKAAEDQILAIEDAGGIANRQALGFEGTQSIKPKELCARWCNMLSLDFRVQTIAESLTDKVPMLNSLAGRSPLSNAAACIYFASHLLNNGRSSKMISDVAGVSDATIKHAYKLLLSEKDRLIEPSWLGPQPVAKDTGIQSVGDVSNLPSN